MISHLRKSEESEREGTSFHEIISETVIHIPASLCASLRSENDCHLRLWLGCEFTMLYNAHNMVKGSDNFQRLYLVFCLTPRVQILTKYP